MTGPNATIDGLVPLWPASRIRAILRNMRLLIALPLFLFPAALQAETPISAAEFESRVTGKVLTYSAGGAPYGMEEYLEGRLVRWSFLDGKCQEGRWYVAGEQICFVYEDIAEPQCWQFYAHGNRIVARFENDPMSTELYETSSSSDPLLCLGPEIGV